MNAKPKVTVLVPSYNHGRYLRQRIQSIFAQTYDNFELIVIDDCSPDDSDQVVQELLEEYSFQYIRNPINSGTPFSAWERVATLATGDYIWVCESDDYAEPGFLHAAVESLRQDPKAVLFYCSSWVVDEEGNRVGHTDDYFHDIWQESRWDGDFATDGRGELADFQLRGQTVPNMSSALIATGAFCKAYDPFLKRLKLTGDWLFIGYLMCQGDVLFSHCSLNNFRKHEVTSRATVKSARSQAEFLLTKHLLFKKTGKPVREFAHVMRNDVVRFLHEPASLAELIKALVEASLWKSLALALLLALSVATNARYLGKFYERYKLVKKLEGQC